MEKPSLPSGTRDFGPGMMAKRRYIIDTIVNIFRLYGFSQIETPALENLKTLQGKYGDEGDQLLFKVLNNGDFLSKVNETLLAEKNSKALTPQIADRGLRYDLTVPLARFVVMNRNDINFPFKRFQVQPVWRADRPQKGRYREFWQCDADVVGSKGIVNEIELIQIYLDVFAQLNLPVVLKINHRKFFDSLEKTLGGKTQLNRFMQLIDKNDKIGFEGVAEELKKEGLESGLNIWHLIDDLNKKDNTAKLNTLQTSELIDHETLTKGMADIQFVLDSHAQNKNVVWDLTLARGLSYYTGWVFEVVPQKSEQFPDFSIGSIGGGGRYDNLTEIFGLKDVSGVGISFGLDRIYDTLEQLQLFPENIVQNAQVIVCPVEESQLLTSVNLAQQLRKQGISATTYPEASKLKKQLDYANSMNIEFAVLIGSRETETQTATVKNLASGEQREIKFDQLAHKINSWNQ